MLHHPITLGVDTQQKTTALPAAEFILELRLLSHHQPQLEKIKLAVLTSYDWKPSLADPVIGKTPIPSVQDALRAWAQDMDDWHMADADSCVSFDQALDAQWCTRHKNKDRLKEFLRVMDFPARYLEQELISKPAYEKALEVYAVRRAEKAKSRMQKSRNKKRQTAESPELKNA